MTFKTLAMSPSMQDWLAIRDFHLNPTEIEKLELGTVRMALDKRGLYPIGLRKVDSTGRPGKFIRMWIREKDEQKYRSAVWMHPINGEPVDPNTLTQAFYVTGVKDE